MIDAASVLSIGRFWLAILVCGLLAWPLAAALFPADRDRGYLAAKPLGWLIGAFFAWACALLGVSFADYGWLAGLAGLGLTAAIFARKRTHLPPLARILQWETAFLAMLLAGVIIKGGVPDISGLEKFMDFGFVNAALRGDAMPPPDPWWAGEPIHYYYFGHVAAAWLIQLSGVPADHGFNLMIALIFAFTASIAYRLVQGTLSDAAGSERLATVCGVAAAALVTIGGNFHSVLYGPFRAFSPTTYDRDFFFPDSTRFIGFDPPADDKGFTEMPGYGFAVGDLHAHVLNLPTAFLMALLLMRFVRRESGPDATGGVRWTEGAVLALLFGITAMCNSWDTVSYGILMGLAGLFTLIRPGERLKRLAKLVLAGLLIVAGAAAVALPFLIDFKPIASGLVWFDGRSRRWQLGVLYGHLALPCLILAAGLMTSARRDPRFVAGAALAIACVCLVALPEIVYVKDIYGADHRRANTMFKLTFQAQPLAAMAGMILVGLLLSSRRRLTAAAGVLIAVPLLSPLSYGLDIYWGGLREIGSRKLTLDGLGFIDRNRPDDRALIDWLKAQPRDTRILFVEAPGNSFTESSRLSAMTGVPALLGWRGHEWLWRGDAQMVFGRGDEIDAFYRSTTRVEACALIRKYGVTHVAIGTVERETYPDLDQALFTGLGRVVASRRQSTMIAVDPAACVT